MNKEVYLKEECGYCRWCDVLLYSEHLFICTLEENENLFIEIEDTCSKWEAYDE